MEQTCPSCYSCGMPLEKLSDHALGNLASPYCVHCTDEKGELKPFEEILNGTANYLVGSQGIDQMAAIEMAKGLLAKQPAWKDLSH